MGTDITTKKHSNNICSDCLDAASSSTFKAGSMGSLDLKTVKLVLDNGKGNALILEQPDNTYFLPSPIHAGVTTTFRGMSLLDSLQAYQTETPNQFTSNPDYQTAKKILGAVAY